jgi:hypothetical protein
MALGTNIVDKLNESLNKIYDLEEDYDLIGDYVHYMLYKLQGAVDDAIYGMIEGIDAELWDDEG